MHILMVTASLPYPPHQGGALRSYGILHGLHQANHKTTLLSFDEGESAADTTPLAALCRRIETHPPPSRSRKARLRDLLLTGEPDIARRLFSDSFWQRLQALVTETRFDLIQFEGIEVACYLPLLERLNTGAKLVYDAFNAEAALQQMIFAVDRRTPHRWPAAGYSFIQSRRIAHFEAAICQQADCVIAVSDEDAAILSRLRPDGAVPIITNGIFVDDYMTTAEQLDLGNYTLVFTGKMDYRPNVDAMLWFADAVLPDIQRILPQTRLIIVGQKPHPRLDSLRARPGIEITGWVRDVKPFLYGASVYIAPLRMGSGTRLKLLEAMAAGCAVVATPIASSGMRAVSPDIMVITDQPDQMAAAIINLLEDPAQRRALGSAARSYVRMHYDWSVLIPRLLAVYRDMGLE